MTPPNGNGLAAAEVQATSQATAEPRARGTAAFPALEAIATLGAIQVLTMGFTLVRSKVVAVTLGPAGVGAIGLIDQVTIMVAQICTFSLPFAAVKFLSEAHSESRQAFADLYIAFLRLLLLISVLGTGIGIALLLKWPAVLGQELAAYSGLVILALLSIPPINVSALVTNTVAAAQRARASAFYGFYVAASIAALAAGGAVWKGLRGYYWGNLIALLLVASGGVLYLRWREGLGIHRTQLSVYDELRSYPKVVGFAAALYVASFTGPMADLVARYAVLHSGGIAAVGLFQAAIGIAIAMRTVVRSSFAIFLTPAVNRRTEVSDKLEKSVEFLKALSIATGIMALPLVLFPDVFLFLLYSRKFVVAGPYVYLYVVAIMMQLFGAVNQALLVGLNRIGAYATTFVIGDLATALLSWWLVPHLGFNGVGIALLSNGVIVFGLTAYRLWSTHQVKIHEAMGVLPIGTVALVAATGGAATFFTANTPSIVVGKMLACAILGSMLLVSAPHKGSNVFSSLWNSLKP